MDSDSQEFQIATQNINFFKGFSTTSKLAEKQKKLRAQIKENSYLQTKQTPLDQKVQKIVNNRKVEKQKQEKKDISQITKVKVAVEGNANNSNEGNKEKKFNKSFQDLRMIKPLLKAVNQLEYTRPTPIQQLAIPVILSGRDVVGSSITGSGKTAAFVLPILQRYYNAQAVGYIRSLIVTPTRQLALQIYEQFSKLNKYTKLQAVLTIGASSLQRQENQLRNNPELVIGTPGRIIDLLLNSRSIGMQNLQMIIFDEADKLLELGFQAQIKQIMDLISQEVQTVLFSATMNQQMNKLTTATTRKPIRISADPDHKTAQKLHQQVVKLKNENEEYREAVLLSILLNVYSEKVIVFFKTKKECHRMTIILGLLGAKVCELHGNLSQTQRLDAFLQFKEGKYNFMMATDLASRGLDIKQVKTVINFQMPAQLTRYIHRIGRTARAGCIGTSLTLCNDSQCLDLKKMSKKTGDKLYKLTVDEKVVKESQRNIHELAREINNILSQEREERDLRKADMELQKLQNVTNHRDQIYSRPKKQWFITEKQKKQIQQKAKKEAGVLEEVKASSKNNKNNKNIRNGKSIRNPNRNKPKNKSNNNNFKRKPINKNKNYKK